MKRIASIIFASSMAAMAFAQCSYTITPDIVSELGLLNSLRTDTSAPSVAVTNLRTGQFVHTGFVHGTAAASIGGSAVGAVEVAFDGGEYTTATGTTTWSMALPAGAKNWRMDSTHTISVRALGENGVYSEVTTLSVKKGRNRDINGDGYQDLVVGAINSGGGQAFIFLGSATGITSKAANAADAALSSEGGGHEFGNAIALGDINGDGYADLLIGARLYNSPLGRAYIFNGSAAGIATQNAASADSILSGSGQNFGNGIALGDVNGDGYADALIGEPGVQGNTASVYYYQSAGAGGIPTGGTGTAAATITHATLGELGYSVALGDINGDGFADALIGRRRISGDSTGTAFVFHSTGAGGLPSTNSSGADATITGEAANNNLGGVVLLRDMNGDGFADALIGAIGASTSQGRVYYFPSAGAGGITGGNASTAPGILTGETNAGAFGPEFGTSISAGDVNGDGYPDLHIGSPGADAVANDSGRSYLILSSGASGIVTANASSAHAIYSGTTALGNLGRATALIDINGDGYADAFASNTPAGGKDLHYFQSAGATGLTSQDLGTGGSSTATLSNAAGGAFGEVMGY